MAILQIDLFDQTNNRRIWVSLRDNLPILDLIQKLVSDLELKQGEYELLDEDSGRKLSEEATLKEEGVEDEQLLRLRKKKKIPVIVPIPIIPPGKVSAETQVPPVAEPRPSDGAAILEKGAGAQAPQPSKSSGAQMPNEEVEKPKGRRPKPAPTAKPARRRNYPRLLPGCDARDQQIMEFRGDSGIVRYPNRNFCDGFRFRFGFT
jgi:hypothetical protein